MHGSASSDRRKSDLARLSARLVREGRQLVRGEIALATLQAKQDARRYGAVAAMFGGAGLVGFVGAGCLVAGFLLGLCNVLQPWLAALITAGVLFLLALLAVVPGWMVARRRPVTAGIAHNVREDVAAMRAGWRDRDEG